MPNIFRDHLLAEQLQLRKKLDAINVLLEQAPEAQPAPVTKRGRKPMSAAARKAHSERMKAFWARQKKGK